MNKTRLIRMLLLAAVLVMAACTVCFAQSTTFKESCSYDGKDINSRFNSNEFASTLKNLQPGDDVSYIITYKNSTKENTKWYMRNKVLETLEEQKEAAENGGYTYVLTNVGPDGKEKVLFSNEKVGGETKTTGKDLEGLLQATNATKEYFFVQDLSAGQSATTKLHIIFDGETEVNDYMDTKGALMVSYAVEKADENGNSRGDKNPPTLKRVKTGDQNSMLFMVGVVAVAIVLLILAFVFWRREQKKEEGEEV